MILGGVVMALPYKSVAKTSLASSNRSIRTLGLFGICHMNTVG